jgi:hypothetical protein
MRIIRSALTCLSQPLTIFYCVLFPRIEIPLAFPKIGIITFKIKEGRIAILKKK